MTIKVKNEEALVIKIAESINGAAVSYGRYADFPDARDLMKGFDLESDTLDKIHRHCGENGLYALVRSEINQVLTKNYPFDSNRAKIPLRNFSEFSEPIVAAKNIVKRIKVLPARYRASVQLPAHFSIPLLPYVAAVKLYDSFVICRADRLPKHFPMSSENDYVDKSLFSDPFTNSSNTDRELSSDRLFFTSVELGYATVSSGNLVCTNFMDKVRAIYGACIALGFFTTEYGGQHDKKPFIILHTEAEEREIIATEELDSDLWDHRWQRSTKRFVESSSDPSRSIRAAFEKISIILGDDEFSRRLFTACIWYYRAKISRNSLDSLLHATIAIEALLGDRDTSETVGLARLLGNRCAYLLGRSRKSRQAIIDEFLAIYRLRSAIVHSGKHKLEHNERKVSDACLRLCGDVISKELDLHHSSDLDEAIPF